MLKTQLTGKREKNQPLRISLPGQRYRGGGIERV
jgi:hypothetical protein